MIILGVRSTGAVSKSVPRSDVQFDPAPLARHVQPAFFGAARHFAIRTRAQPFSLSIASARALHEKQQ
jgi:hypothetical protein